MITLFNSRPIAIRYLIPSSYSVIKFRVTGSNRLKLQILIKTKKNASLNCGFLVKLVMQKVCCNSWNKCHIDRKLRSTTNKKSTTPKDIQQRCQDGAIQIMINFLFFFLLNSKPLEAQPVNYKILYLRTFYLFKETVCRT